MKRFIFISFFILSICIVLPLNASELVIRVFDGSNFYVEMNGRQYLAYFGSVTISGLDHGSHRIEIFKENINAMPRYQMVYAGHVNVPHNKRIIAELDCFNVLRIIRKENMYEYSYGNGYGNPNGYNSWYGYYDYGNNFYYGSTGSYGTYGGYSYGMAPETFDALMMTLDRESFDSRKLSVASNAIVANGVTTYQLADIMSMLSFDSNRLKLAKRSYPYIADKNNVFILNNAFTFSSNADEFFKYIGAW